MTESKESKIKKSKTSHFINDYTSYIQKINQEEINNDNEDNNKKGITTNSSISQTKDQSNQDRFMLNSKSLSMNTIEGCYKNKIRFDIKGIPIKKGKPNSHHISYLDNIPPFTNTQYL